MKSTACLPLTLSFIASVEPAKMTRNLVGGWDCCDRRIPTASGFRTMRRSIELPHGNSTT